MLGLGEAGSVGFRRGATWERIASPPGKDDAGERRDGGICVRWWLSRPWPT
jgi:hypothetical protein